MKKKYSDSIIITIMVFAIIALFSLIPLRTGILDPVSKAVSDFDIYDLVYSKLREDPKADTNIVLVNIGSLSRSEIAREIDSINKFKPGALALDIFFWKEKDPSGDSLLARALSRSENLIMVSMLDKYIEDIDSYDTLASSMPLFTKNAVTGYANFPEDEKGSFRTIRTFRPFAFYKSQKEAAFPVKIVERVDRESYDRFLRRNNETEIINYRGSFNKFYFLEAYSLLEGNANLRMLKDKIVIMGYMGENRETKSLEDIFFTPLNDRYAGRSYPDMYGVVVNANIVSMLMHGDFIDRMPYSLSILLAIVFCYLCTIGLFTIKSKYKDWFGLAFKWFILLITILELDLGVNIFNYFNYKINLTLLLAAIVLTPSCMELYQIYVEKWLKKIKIKMSREEKDEVGQTHIGNTYGPLHSGGHSRAK